MKKIGTLIFAVLVAASAAMSQSKTIEAFHSKYKDDRDATVVSLSGGLFELLSQVASWDESDEEAQAISRIAENIKSMNILQIPLYKSGFDNDDIDKMRADLGKENYKELMTVRDGSENVYFLTQGDKNTVKNMLILIKEDNEFAVLSIDGSLEMKDLSYLAKHHKNWH